MTWSETTVVVAVVLMVVLWRAWVVASRLDRLHRKVAASRAALESQLVRRASAAAELAASGVLDPASAVLVTDSAWSALSAGGYGGAELARAVPDLAEAAASGLPSEADARPVVVVDDPWTQAAVRAQDRAVAESELSRTLRSALADPEEVARAADGQADELLEALSTAWYRVQLARRFHNEAVAQAQRVRRKRAVRALRLAGHAPEPETVEIDDGWPDGLPRWGQAT